jgi:hypothetical protein
MALELKAKVSLDGSGFQSGIEKMAHGAEHFSHSLKELALEAFGIVTVTEAIKKTIEQADQLVDTANRIGVGVEKLQEFGYAAKMTGAHMEDLVGFVEKLNSARVDPKKFGSFQALGLGGDLKAPVEELILKLSANVRGRSPQEFIQPLRDIGGRGAGSLIPMLRDDMEELMESAKRLGQVMTTQDAVALKFLDDEMKTLAQTITVGLAPALVYLMDIVNALMSRIKADASFWGNFSQGKSLDQMVTGIARTLITDPSNQAAYDKQFPGAKQAAQDFINAGASSAAELQEMKDAWAKQKSDLLEKQLALQRIGAMPDFQDAAEKEKRQGLSRISSDSLLKTGNFLGENAGNFTDIARQQLDLLRLIEANTRPSASAGAGGDTVNFGNP